MKYILTYWDYREQEFATIELDGEIERDNVLSYLKRDGCANIFESVAFWESHRYKLELGRPYLFWLIDTIGELGKVNIKKCDTPEKLMKALDKAGL